MAISYYIELYMYIYDDIQRKRLGQRENETRNMRGKRLNIPLNDIYS